MGRCRPPPANAPPSVSRLLAPRARGSGLILSISASPGTKGTRRTGADLFTMQVSSRATSTPRSAASQRRPVHQPHRHALPRRDPRHRGGNDRRSRSAMPHVSFAGSTVRPAQRCLSSHRVSGMPYAEAIISRAARPSGTNRQLPVPRVLRLRGRKKALAGANAPLIRPKHNRCGADRRPLRRRIHVCALTLHVYSGKP